MSGPLRGAALELRGPAGRIEAELAVPAEEPRGAALLCHPHPLFGGNLHSKVVYRAARACTAAGFAALRFNFRGAGLSAGAHDGGRGESDDARLALDWLEQRFPGRPLLAAGYSFGAWVALRAGALHPRAAGLLGVGLATRYHDYGEVLATPARVLLVQGERDELGPLEEVRALALRFAPPARLAVIAGADHFFASGLPELAGEVQEFCAALAAEPGR